MFFVARRARREVGGLGLNSSPRHEKEISKGSCLSRVGSPQLANQGRPS